VTSGHFNSQKYNKFLSFGFKKVSSLGEFSPGKEKKAGGKDLQFSSSAWDIILLYGLNLGT
jgi:hypothetical protein